jgi:hypothetical protein
MRTVFCGGPVKMRFAFHFVTVIFLRRFGAVHAKKTQCIIDVSKGTAVVLQAFRRSH